MNRIPGVFSAAAAVALLSLTVNPSPARAQLIRPDISVGGVSQRQLTADWWNWAASFPDGANPVQETTGTLSGLGNRGSYFFLAGAFVQTPVARTVTVSSSQSLFFPLLNVLSPAPFFGNTEAELRQDASDDLGVVSNLFLTLNGSSLGLPAPTTSLLDYRQLSPPGLFNLVLPVNNVFGIPADTYGSVSDGVWVALAPLTQGVYTLHFGGTSVGTGAYAGDTFTQDITYTIVSTNAPEPGTLSLIGIAGAAVVLRLQRRLSRERRLRMRTMQS